MIGIRTVPLIPTVIRQGPHRVVHHVLRCAMGASHLAHGLLRKDGGNLKSRSSQCGQMTGRSKADAITKTE
jgi:hypothetical protein